MKKVWTVLLALLLIVTALPVTPLTFAADRPAQTDEQPSLPKIPDGFTFSPYTRVDENGRVCYYIQTAPSEYGYIYGYWIDAAGRKLPPDGNVLPREAKRDAQPQSFPETYDARDFGYITPVEAQSGGTCWAHAATAVMEANAIKKGYATADSIDLDEYYFVWFGRTGYDASADDSRYDGLQTTESLLDAGGNDLYVENATGTFSGPVLESRFSVRTLPDDLKRLEPEEDAVLLASMEEKYTTDARFQYDYVNTNIVRPLADVDSIKSTVLQYGAAALSFYTAEDYYSDLSGMTPCAYYCPESTIPNHSVTVVGWDDNFSFENFSPNAMPSENGAWLVKNSWGEMWGNEGYFWLSYEDASICDVAAYEVEQVRDFETVCSYNGIPATNPNLRSPSSYKSIRSAGAVFTVTGDETQYLRKVAFGYAGTAASYPYSFKIYRNLPATYSNPTAGTLVYQQQGSNPSGNRFIDVAGEIELTPGQRYSVVFNMYEIYNVNFPIYYEGSGTLGESYYKSAPKETFYNDKGVWYDTNASNLNNLYIQAVTGFAHEDAPVVTFVCPGGYRETQAALDGAVTLPQTDGCTWALTYQNAPFDGTNVTHDMTVLAHCYPTVGTAKPGAPCTRQFKCVYCGEAVKPEETAHTFTDVTVPASPMTPGYTRHTCETCGISTVDSVNYYPGSEHGKVDDVYWQYFDGTLSFAGSGAIKGYKSTSIPPWYDYSGSAAQIVIHEGVTAVGNYDFYQFTGLQTVTLPNGLTAIGTHAFDGATALSTVHFGADVATIGEYAFKDCTALTEAVLPGSVTSCGAYIYDGCKNVRTLTVEEGVTALNRALIKVTDTTYQLETVSLPSTLQTLNPAFYSDGLLTLKTVTVPAENPNFSAVDGVLFNKAQTRLILFPPAKTVLHYVIPETVSSLAESAFAHCSGVRFLDLSGCGVTVLPKGALYQLHSVERINLPQALTQIDSQSVRFASDCGLSALFVPSSVTTVASNAISAQATMPTLFTDSASAAIKTFADGSGYTCTVLDAHTHAFSETLSEEPSTCTVRGSRISGCDCGNFVSETLELSDVHQKTNGVVTAPTCTAKGYTTYTCDLCGLEYRADETPMIAHAFTRQIASQGALKSPADCEHAATYYYTCATCDLVEANDNHTFQIGDPNGHSFTLQNVSSQTLKSNADCEHAAAYYYTCAACGLVEMNDGHTFQSGNPNGHSFEWVIDQDATCGAAGVKHEYCPACGQTRSENTAIPPTGAHSFTLQNVSSDTLKSNADCTHAATYYYTCATCGGVERNDAHVFQSGNPNGHSFEWVIDQDATCGAAGVKHEYCPACGQTRSENTAISPTGAHSFTQQNVSSDTLKSNADCTHAATYYYTCATCGGVERNDAHVFQSGSALGHTSPNSDGRCGRCGAQIADPTPQRDPNACKYCGEVHGGFFGWLVKLFHNILFAIRGPK